MRGSALCSEQPGKHYKKSRVTEASVEDGQRGVEAERYGQVKARTDSQGAGGLDVIGGGHGELQMVPSSGGTWSHVDFRKVTLPWKD